MRAVIFDLWDTLVDWPHDGFAGLRVKLADRLGLDRDRFDELWRAGHARRQVSTLADTFRRMGADEDALDELVALRLEFTRAGLVPREGAVETLERLRERGLRTGLISVCTEEVPDVFAETALAPLVDSALFSATCGLAKPDPRVYLLSCEQLGVEPHDALFVGDGANDELAGAERVGLRGVLVHRPGEEPFWEEARSWQGARITSLEQILDLV